jgi:CDP-diacylglycerol--serine O-phosphatidyltransferase
VNIKKHIPNAITSSNLFCGCLALIKTFEGDLVWAAYLVGIAVILDFFDGFAARMLKVASPIGKDLDSLADMVTFGAVPAFMMYKLIDLSYILAFTKGLAPESGGSGIWSNYTPNNLVKYAGLIIAVFSALRLAKFNHDKRQTDAFIGLPTPANALFICGFPLIFNRLGFNFSEVNELLSMEQVFRDNGDVTGSVCLFILTSPLVLVISSVVLSLLLVSEIPLLALKFKNFSWKDNEPRFVLIGLSAILLILLQWTAIPLVIVLYLLLSIVNNIFSKTKV